MTDGTTTIQIDKETRQRLGKVKGERLQEGDTWNASYDDIINYLYKFYRNNK